MSTDSEIYDALCSLLPSQFEEVLLNAGVPQKYIPPPANPAATRAQAVVDWMQQSANNRDRLMAALRKAQEPGGTPPSEGWIERLKKLDRRYWRHAVTLVGLIAVALAYSLFVDENDGTVTPTTTLPTTPSTTTPPSVDPTRIVRGTIQVPPQNGTADLTAFAIVADSGDTTETASPDRAGVFRAAGIPEGPDVRLTWSLGGGRSAEAAFVLWPLQHPPQPRSPYDGFSASKLTDVVESEKDAIRREVRSGRHGLESRARRKADALRELFAVLETAADVRIGGLPVAKREFKLWQDICHASAEFRDAKGRSRISDDQIDLEREWRRDQITVAAKRDLDRDLVRALNGWAAFSRQAYSRSMAAWPERPLAEDMLEHRRWLKPAQDDVELVLTNLAKLRSFLERSGLLRQLARNDRLLYDSVSAHSIADSAAGAGPESVAMSRLVYVLAALNKAVGPGES